MKKKVAIIILTFLCLGITACDTNNNSEAKLDNKNTTIFIYCRSGNRSVTAAKALVKMGYTKIYNLGGINDWPYQIESK